MNDYLFPFIPSFLEETKPFSISYNHQAKLKIILTKDFASRVDGQDNEDGRNSYGKLKV